MTTAASTAIYIGDPYRRQSPQRGTLTSKISLDPSFVPWRKYQKTHSSASLNTAYGRRHSLESLSAVGSLRHASIGGRSLRWKLQIPVIEKFSDVAHIHYDLVELGPIKVELLPLGSDFDSDTSTSSINRRSYHHHYQRPHQLQNPSSSALPILRERGNGSVRNSSGHLIPGREAIDDATASSSSSTTCSPKESNRRVGAADVFQKLGGADCATATGGAESSSTKIRFTLRVQSNQQSWTIQRTYEDFVDFDKQLHRCVFHRHYSLLSELPTRANTALTSPSTSSPSSPLPLPSTFAEHSSLTDEAIWTTLSRYMERFSDLAGSLITCFPVLKWLELDNRGNHLVAAEETEVNTPGAAAAYVVQNYTASASDELTLKIGDIVSIIEPPHMSESIWWKGKLTILKAQYADGDTKLHNLSKFDGQLMPPGAHFTIQVGYFPSHCVQVFGRVTPSLPGALRENAVDCRPVFRRRSKWATMLRLFLANRPSRRLLKEAGILRERVFGCDLAEHLENAGIDVPVVLKSCAGAIETYGIVDGIYRGSGVVSNIHRLRNAFDENRIPNLAMQDVHCVASLLKMYFRELPNPLLTFQLYGAFVDAVDGNDSSLKILRLHDVVQRLPPPYFRTAEFLVKHLSRLGEHGHKTGMHYPNLALVWAPNLLRSKELSNVKESTTAVLRNVNTQAVVIEYLIRYADIIFSRKMPSFSSPVDVSVKRRTRPLSLACPPSVCDTPPTAPTVNNLEEARRKLLECQKEKVPANVGLPDLSNRRCIDIEVNSGPPPKYHTIIQLPKSKSLKHTFGTGGTGSWRTLFRRTDETGRPSRPSSYRNIPSPVISRPKLLRPPVSVCAFNDRNEEDGSFRKRLRHVRSAENFQASPSGKGGFVSLDSCIRKAAAGRSVTGPRSTFMDHSPESPIPEIDWSASPATSPMDSSPTFSYTPRASAGFVDASNNTRASLKSCRTTDIDRVLSVVVDSSPTVLSLQYNDGIQDVVAMLGQDGTSCSTAPSPPVSEPPAFSEDASDDGEWIRNLLESSFAAIDDSSYDDKDLSLGSCKTKERKAFSAPNSLRRPGDRKEEASVEDEKPTTLQPEVSADTADVLISPVDELLATVENGFIMGKIELRKDQIEMVQESEPLTRQLSESEEKLLLAELRMTPPENSPSHEDLRSLFPNLEKICSSLEELPVVISAIEDEDTKEKCYHRAPSITDLEVIETNPEWRSPGRSVADAGLTIFGNGLPIDRSMANDDIRLPWEEAVSSVSLDEVTDRKSSAAEYVPDECDIRDLLADVKERVVDAPTMLDHAAKFISFPEANAVFDRRETLQVVQSGRYESEEEDSMLLDSIYDNVAPMKGLDSKLKPTPKPRVSKLKAPLDDSSSNYARISHADVAPMTKPQRPVVLTVATNEHQKNWSSSEESELANSPLFRKQQQHLFALAPSSRDGDRNISEPPCGKNIQGDGSAKLEMYPNQATSSAEDVSGHPRRPYQHFISASPRSAFSPVLPKTNVSANHGNEFENGNNQLHSILSTSTKKSPSLKSTKNAHVYFV